VLNVYLEQRIQIDPGYLLGAAIKGDEKVENPLVINLPLSQADCYCHVDGMRFSASLLSVGDGYGIHLKEYL